MVVVRWAVTYAIWHWLREGIDRPVGLLQAPTSAENERPFPYAILYSVDGGGYDGPGLVAPDADATLVYQVNAAALRPEEAEPLLDAVRGMFLDRHPDGTFIHPAPSIDGWKVVDRRPYGASGGTEYNGAPPRRVFTSSERFVVTLTPSS